MEPIWERLPGESAKAYEAFCKYRDMPPGERSLREVARRLGKSETLISRWSSRYRWVERVQAWDDEVDRKAREAHLRTVKEMRERHARYAVALQMKALDRLKQMDPDELEPLEVLKFIVEAAKLERLARGEPDTIQEHTGKDGGPIEHRHNFDLSRLSIEELRSLERILSKASESGGSETGTG